MKTSVAKTFIKAIDEFHQKPESFKKYLSDKRLTVYEKTLLKAWNDLRHSRFQEIIDSLDKLKGIQDEFIVAQKDLILGITYNDKSNFTLAIRYLEQAEKVLNTYDYPYFHFMIQYNKFVCYYNMKNKVGVKSTFVKLKKINPNHLRQKISFLDCAFTYYLYGKDYNSAYDSLCSLKNYYQQMNDQLKAGYFYNWFQYAISLEDFELAQKNLDRLKNFKVYHSGTNSLYMKVVLDFLWKGKPIYIQEAKYKEYPSLYWQLKVLKSLEECNYEDALTFWKKLQVNSYETYQENFTYSGDICLFSLALKKFEKVIKKSSSIENKINTGDNKEELLLKSLLDSEIPIPKNVLFRLIWKEEMKDHKDDLKIQKLISRLRDKTKHEIRFKKGCYYLKRAS